MDNDKKLFDGLLKADGIDPAGITDTERETFRAMLDSEQKNMKHLSWIPIGAMWVFALGLLGLCFSEKILEALRIPFIAVCVTVIIATLVVIIKYMPGHNRKIMESNRKVQKLYRLVHGKNRGIAMVVVKNGKRVIRWPSLLIFTFILWLGVSLAGAGFYYILCRGWIYSSTSSSTMWIAVFLNSCLPLSILVSILRSGLKAPLDELTEIKSKPKPPKPGLRHDAWMMIMQSRISKIAAAAIVISILIPISVGASRAIKRLIVKPAWRGTAMMDFKTDREIHFDMRVGTKESPDILLYHRTVLFVEDGQLLGTLRSDVMSWPKFKWRTRIEVVDVTGKSIASTEQVCENGGTKDHDYPTQYDYNMHFSLGAWNDGLQKRAKEINVKYAQVSEDVATTPDAWIESSKIDVVHGRVTDADGKPVANAMVQIREERKKGQTSIDAKDVFTDRDGYYCFDDLRWRYSVGVVVYDHDLSGKMNYHRYKRYNRALDGTEKVDFKFEKFPKGTAVLSGRIFKPDGSAAIEFRIDVRNKVDWKDHSGQYLYQYGLVKNFVSPDGKFEISGLAPGVSSIGINLTGKEFENAEFDLKYFQQECELVNGNTTEITNETEVKKAKKVLDKSVSYYGRILYANGKPAVPPVPPWKGANVHVRLSAKEANHGDGFIITRLGEGEVDKQGYFEIKLDNEQLENIKNGKQRIRIMHPSYEDENHSNGIFIFPVEMLSKDRDTSKAYKLAADSISEKYKNHKWAQKDFDTLERALKSYYILDELSAALMKFSGKRRGRLPANLNKLTFADSETRTWIMENVQYQPVKKKSTETAVFPIAYDKTLYEKIKGTHVLFSDGTIKFLRQRELEIIEN